MSNALVYGFRETKINGRTLVQIKNNSVKPQPILIQFQGSLTVEHLFTVQSKKSYTAIIEADANLLFDELFIELSAKMIQPFCRFDFNVITESEFYQLPEKPLLLKNDVSDYSKHWEQSRSLLQIEDGFRVDTGLNSRMSGWLNGAVGDVTNFEYSATLQHTGSSSYFNLGLIARDHFVVHFDKKSTSNAVMKIHVADSLDYQSRETQTWPSLIDDVLPFGEGVNQNFTDAFNVKISADGDLFKVKAWLTSQPQKTDWDIQFDINNASFPSGVTKSDLDTGKLGIMSASRGSSSHYFTNLKYETIRK